MNLNLNQKAELDALVNFFGGKSALIIRWKHDRLIQSLRRHGLTRWGKVRGGMFDHIATKNGIAVAKRFKKDWSAIWGEMQPKPELE